MTSTDGSLYINNAKIIIPDILTRNGVMHVIDQVLNPNNEDVSVGGQAFPGASSVPYVPFTSGVPTPTSSLVTSAGYLVSSSATESASTASSTAPDYPVHTSSKSGVGAIAGGLVGGVIFVALILSLIWFMIRNRFQEKPNGTTTSSSGSHERAVTIVGRKETTKSYHKPELEATTRQYPYQKPELEAGAVTNTGPDSKAAAAPAVNEIQEPMSRVRSELSGTSAPQGTSGSPTSPTTARRETSTQEEQRRLLQKQEDEEARLADIAHQRRKAELEYQKKMAELEHEQRMAELDITAARLRSRNRTLSELEAKATPGSRSGE